MEERILVTRTAMPDYDIFIEKIKPLWESKRITNMGEYHKQLENKLMEYMDVENVSLMANGHLALELAIQAMEFPEGSEIITTPFTFVSTTHAIVRNRLTPVFCDIKLSDYTIDEEKIEELITEKTVAIIPVHVYGNICNIEKIESLARKYHLKVIYDAAHTFGEKYKGISVGRFGDASMFSFHATKVFNTIEGGAVTCHDKELYERLYNLKNFGIRGEERIVGVGANAKMNEFSAIMGLCNLEILERTIREREVVVRRYLELLSDLPQIKLPSFDDENMVYNYAYFPVMFESEEVRNWIYTSLSKKNIYARKYFYPLTVDADCFRGKYADLSLENARRASRNILVLPLYGELPPEIQKVICEIVRGCVKGQIIEDKV